MWIRIALGEREVTLKTLIVLAVGCGILSHYPAVAGAADQKEPLHVVVNLDDSSRLIGEINLTEIQLISDAVGKVTIPLERINGIKFGKEEKKQVMIALKNGDTLKGAIELQTFKLQTLFGVVTVNINRLVDLSIHAAGTEEIGWESLPFPRNCDWPGPRGIPSVVEDGAILVQGDPIQTKNTFSVPANIGFELNMEEVVAAGSSLRIDFSPEGHARDTEGECLRVDLLFCAGADKCDGETIDVFHRNDSLQNTPSLHQNLSAIAPGKVHRVNIHLMDDGVQVVVDDQTYEAPGAKVPYEHFQIRLSNWQPASRIRVSKLTVH